MASHQSDIPLAYLLVKGLLMSVPLLIKTLLPSFLLLLGILRCQRRFMGNEVREPSQDRCRVRTHSATYAAEPRLSTACATCGQTVSAAVEEYCRARPQVFGGMVYCFDHQKPIKARNRAA